VRSWSQASAHIVSSVEFGGSSGVLHDLLADGVGVAPASRNRLPSMYSVKLPPSAWVMNPTGRT
jgi:hypothetical protein